MLWPKGGKAPAKVRTTASGQRRALPLNWACWAHAWSRSRSSPPSPSSYFRSLDPETRKLRAWRKCGPGSWRAAVLRSLSPRPVLSGCWAVSHGAALATVAPSPSATWSHPELPSAGEDLGQPGILWLRGNPLSWACPLLRQGVPGGPASRLDVRGACVRPPCPSCPKIEQEGLRHSGYAQRDGSML